MPSNLPPLDIRPGPITWKMHGGWLVCDWCNTVLATAGIASNTLRDQNRREAELHRVWFPLSNRYQWVCTECDGLRFQYRATRDWMPAGFVTWFGEHMAACAKHGHGYHEPSFVLRHELGITCSTGAHGWGLWNDDTQALIGLPCATIWPERPFEGTYCKGIWVAQNQIVGWKDKNEWCRCGRQAVQQYDGEGIFYGHYCEACWKLPEFDHIRAYRHDYLDAGEYLDEEI